MHYFEELGAKVTVMRNDAKTPEEIFAMGFDAICLSPGPKSPNEAGICLELIEKLPKDMPLLGVCLGHQSIGQVFGAKVHGAKAIIHGKTSQITTNENGIFNGLPKCFNIARYHSLAVELTDNSNELQIDAITPDNEVMALSHKTRPIYGVQFHPESIASEYGHEVLDNFLKIAEKYKA